jgi:hypothetical protein
VAHPSSLRFMNGASPLGLHAWQGVKDTFAFGFLLDSVFLYSGVLSCHSIFPLSSHAIPPNPTTDVMYSPVAEQHGPLRETAEIYV